MRFDLFRSRLLRGIGALAGASLIVLFAAFPAAAGPVQVDFSGSLGGFYNVVSPTDPPKYLTELEGALAIGAGFSGSFVYDPTAATVGTPLPDGETAYYGLISGIDFHMDHVGGGDFSYDPASAPDAYVGVINDNSVASIFNDSLFLYLGRLLPAIDTIPGMPQIGIGFRAYEITSSPPATLLNSDLPPDDLGSVFLPLGYSLGPDGFRGSGPEFGLVSFDESGVFATSFGASIDSLTFTPIDVPEPAPLGLMLLGIAYVIRRRLRG